jgi:integrase
MRRRRYQSGSLKRRCGKWVGQWWEGQRRRNRVLGPISTMTKSQAKTALDQILAGLQVSRGDMTKDMSLSQFIEGVYYPFYRRKWKRSTAANNINRVNTHVVPVFGDRRVTNFRRDDLQGFLDAKCAAGLSFSMVDHLRWDLKQMFDMAIAEDLIGRNPAALLFTPSDAKRGERLVMTIEEVKRCFAVLDLRELLIVQLTIIAGMRPGEIFGLTWKRVGPDYADIRQRVYNGQVDSPKTVQSIRHAALSQGLLDALEQWKARSINTNPEAWVFPSERGTPLSRDNLLRRSINPKLKSVGLAWVNFQVMRRTHSTLMNNMGVEGKLVADQLGHSLDVNQNVYTKSPVERRKTVVDQLERSLVM